MPELPEVERARKIAHRALAGGRIAHLFCAPDPIVFVGLTPRQVAGALRNRVVNDVCRYGKYLWFVLDRAPFPLFHFGMTGAFHTRAPSQGREVPGDWPPRFTKIRLRMEDGTELVMTNARRLGRIRLVDDPENQPPVANLGFDPFLHLPSPPAFFDSLRKHRRSLKALLLDQSFAAGVGNWVADEVLYQAGIDPRRLASSINAAESKRLHHSLRNVIRTAVRVDADKDRFPKGWLFHHRWGKEANARTRRGDKIAFITLAGRTTAWVPGVQK